MQRRAVSRLASLASRAIGSGPKDLACARFIPALGCLDKCVQSGWIGNTLAPTVGPTPRSFASEADQDYATVFYPEVEAEVGGLAPEFSAVVDGEIKDISLSDYKGKYVILFWYPKDFTFVCPTEIIAFSDRAKEFQGLNAQLIAASTDTPEVHLAWIKTPRKRGGLGYMQIPILADVTKSIAARYGVLKRDAGIALRGLYIINPEGVIEHITMNNFPIGRNVDEAKRTLQASCMAEGEGVAIQFVAEHGEVCPANWTPGGATMHADPEKSLEYFATAEESGDDDEETSSLVHVTNKKQYEKEVSSGKVAVKFWAPWCGKCKMISPYVEELQETHKGVKFLSFDTTEKQLEGLSTELGVKALPAFKFYKDGKEIIDAVTGYKKAPLAAAVKKLEDL
ncbi:Peroxiredoxin-2 [Auxenochlorella protothecoides]|uniref:thioredoxin-dependent peroxiredoxin n=1 Tax=Auxenochlorella protothecoides TaxID=3075 RepID=A0A087SS53_AUXPR|nr:Peroxiredoxin-2 [Auxenochlorella protothecoides]KFM28557.1 Peroxiredoxin-2 [Auxenochlorella protothecoides]